jgi:hypothetical protein
MLGAFERKHVRLTIFTGWQQLSLQLRFCLQSAVGQPVAADKAVHSFSLLWPWEFACNRTSLLIDQAMYDSSFQV